MLSGDIERYQWYKMANANESTHKSYASHTYENVLLRNFQLAGENGVLTMTVKLHFSLGYFL